MIVSQPLPGHPGSPGAVALAAMVAALCVSGCAKPAATPLPPPIVQVAELAPTNVPLFTEIIGQVDSPENAQVRARVEAFVEEVLFIEGREVNQGDVLFKLDDRPVAQRLAAAEAGLAEAKAALNKYEKDVARLTPLAAKRAIPQQDLDNALASVEVGKASVLAAEARVQSAELELSYCQVKAPITGLIGAKQVAIGDLVGKGEPTLMATISSRDPMWFYCSISEAQYLRAEAATQRKGLKMGDLPITLILADGSIHPEKGKFVFIDRAVDVKTGTLRLRAEFRNTDRVLRPGLFGRIRVDLGVRPDSILVPERAVTELQGKNFVWVVDSENKASQRPVQVGEQVGGSLLILEGLKAGERIVVEGIQKVREGSPVQVMTGAQLAQTAASVAPVEKTAKE